MLRSFIGGLIIGVLIAGSVEAQDVWNLLDDWDIYDQGRQGPGMAFGPDEAWTVRDNDSSTGPTLAFTDSTNNYFTPGSQQWIAGYAPGNQAAVFKVYANADPWQDAQLGILTDSEREKPANHNLDPDSGVLDLGDIGAIPGGGGGTGQIVWKAPRDMNIEASFDAYSVGTMLPVGATPDPNNPATQSVRIHFLVRDTPGTGPINPEGEPKYILNGFIPVSLGGNGREFVSGDIAPFAVTAGQEVYIKVNPLNPPMNASRNMIGFSKIEVREFLGSIVDGDFNSDGFWDCLDIDALTAAVASGSTDLAFDMNNDGQITFADVTDPAVGWLAVGGQNNPGATGGNAFLIGDATLDGAVDGQDFIAWNNHKFTTNTAWCDGNFNGDTAIDGQDFIEWNSNKFTSSDDLNVVPEPSTALMAAFALALAAARRYIGASLS